MRKFWRSFLKCPLLFLLIAGWAGVTVYTVAEGKAAGALQKDFVKNPIFTALLDPEAKGGDSILDDWDHIDDEDTFGVIPSDSMVDPDTGKQIKHTQGNGWQTDGNQTEDGQTGQAASGTGNGKVDGNTSGGAGNSPTEGQSPNGAGNGKADGNTSGGTGNGQGNTSGGTGNGQADGNTSGGTGNGQADGNTSGGTGNGKTDGNTSGGAGNEKTDGNTSGGAGNGKPDGQATEKAGVTKYKTYEKQQVDSPYYVDPGMKALTTEYAYEKVDKSYFDDAVFIGDSRTEGMQDYSGLDNATFFAKTGLNVYGLLDDEFITNPSDGKQVSVTYMMKHHKYKKIYFMIGINELGTGNTGTFQKAYGRVLSKFRKWQPDAVIYIQGILPVSQSKSASDPVFNNVNINDKNVAISQFADGKHIFYLDVSAQLTDKKGNLKAEYTFDDVHMYAQYYSLWTDYLMEHAVVRNAGKK